MLIPNVADKLGPQGTLSSFQLVWVLPAIICDNAEELIQATFNRKLNEASFNCNVQSIHIAKTGCQPVKPKVIPLYTSRQS